MNKNDTEKLEQTYPVPCFIRKNIPKTCIYANVIFAGGRDFWIGIYRPTGTALNNFVYDKDHSPITWDNWLPGDPDRLLSNEAMPADCGRACGLVSVSGSRKWCDAPCSRLCYFVCEMKISP